MLICCERKTVFQLKKQAEKYGAISACFLATVVAPIFIASTVALSHPWLGKMWPATKQALGLAWMLHPLVQ